MVISWLIINDTGVDPQQVAPATLTGSPTLVIHKRFEDGFDLWEPVTAAAIPLDDPTQAAVGSDLLGDGDFRFTLTNLQAGIDWKDWDVLEKDEQGFFGVSYDDAFSIELMVQRRRQDRLEARIAVLEANGQI